MSKQSNNKEIKDFVSVEERILKLVREAQNTEWENNRWVILGEPTPKEIKKQKMAANNLYGPSLPNFSVFRCYLLPLGAVTLYALNVPERHCKITTFP